MARLFIVAWSLLLVFMPSYCMAFGGKTHVADFKAVFNGYDDDKFGEFYENFTSKLDVDRADSPDALCQKVRKALAEVYTNDVIKIFQNHRSIGHQWIVGGSIPSASIARFEKAYPGCKSVIEPVWRKFCNDQFEASSRLLGIPLSLRGVNEAFIAIVHSIHLLGDLMPGNTRVDLVLRLPVIKNEVLKRSMILFKGHKEFYVEIKNELNRTMGLPLDEASKAKEMMKTLKKLQFGTKLHACFGATIEKSGHTWNPPE